MDNQANKKAAQGFANSLATSLAESLTEALGSPLHIKVLETPDLSTRQERPVLFRIAAEGAVRGECFLQLYEAQVADLGAKMLGERGSTISDAHIDALAKAIASAMAGLSASLAPEFGKVKFTVERAADLAFGGMLVVPLAASLGDEPEMPLHLYFDGQFLAALSGPAEAKRASETSGTAKTSIDPLNLKLVMDVELNVSLRFGQRQLPLREVLELTSGSVIELDRQVDEPVELLLDGKVIALGEAVIVDGNYGLRVTEVPQPIASHLTA
jgi:flagellar motor switch protein FliN/FliY